MAKIVQDESGQLFLDQGGGILRPVDEAQAHTLSQTDGFGSTAFQAAGQGIENLAGGALSLLPGGEGVLPLYQAGKRQSEALTAAQPVAGLAEYAAPTALGIAGAQAGLVGGMLSEGLLGAVTNPEEPLQGAALGAALGGVGAYAPELLQGARGLARSGATGLGQIGETLPPPNGYAMGMATANRGGGAGAGAGAVPGRVGAAAGAATPDTMAGRVSTAIDEAAGAGKPRWREDLLTPEELDAMGVPLTPGRREALTVAADDAVGIERAQARMLAEDTRGAAGGFVGANHNAAIATAKTFLDDAVRGAAGLPEGIAFDAGTVARRMGEVGDQIGQIGLDAGWIQFPQGQFNRMRNIVDDMSDSMAAPIRRQVDALEKFTGGTHEMTGADYQKVYSRLSNMTKAGNDPEKIQGAVAIMKEMENSLSKNLSGDQLQALKNARYQYRILSRMQKPGSINPDGSLNPRAFRRNWAKDTGGKNRGADQISRLAETIDMITQQRAHTGNTLQRFIDQAPGAVQNNAGAGLMGAAGAAGMTALGGLMGIF